MSRRLLFIAGRTQGMMPAAVAVKAAVSSEMIVRDQSFDPSADRMIQGDRISPAMVNFIPGRSLAKALWVWRPRLDRRGAALCDASRGAAG